MNTLTLKNTLISEINQIDDATFLSALKTIVDSRKASSENLSETYNYDYTLSEQDSTENNFYSQSEIMTEIEKWKNA
ncbi:hypothetical protein EV144_1011335 [Flavobacterium sp. 270]|uniref:hypothetical protein n=1 Tax=Flavobacterium sp. 270 TaxID=2512114 RepID=UPI001064D8B3|nr:hypothetical protein [Flavobacterium sp. 270]TDW52644.1 hypothetical protein EV144_1011335 [Flavobacterium sp. 270]